MKKVSVSLTGDHIDTLDDRQERGEATSRSAALREILDEYDQMRTECEELRTQCEDLRTRLENREDRVDDLEDQLARRSQLEEKIEGLPDKVRDTETYRDRKERMIDRAGLATRLKWKVTGVPVEDETDA
jgi:Arc/MetJ-type ribon-helix-helix transcriptional regulator